MPGTTIQQNGVVPNSQTKEAWPSLQPGQTTATSTISKESPPQSQSPPQAQNGSAPAVGIPSTQPNNNSTPQQNNNNKGEGIGVNSRRGKSNSESKVQAVRNKQKNTQNKEKHGTTRTTSRSESSSSGSGGEKTQQIDEQQDIRNYADEQSSDGSANGRCTDDQGLQINHRQRQDSDSATSIEQAVRDIQLNGVMTRYGEHSESESEPQREGSTPASTALSSSDDSASNGPDTSFITNDDPCDPAVLGEFHQIFSFSIADLF